MAQGCPSRQANAGAVAQVVLAVGRLVVGKPEPLAAASFTTAVGLMYLSGLLAQA